MKQVGFEVAGLNGDPAGESAEELREKSSEPSTDDVELHLHSSVLASQSHHFRHRLISKNGDGPQLPSSASHQQLKATKEDGSTLRVMEERCVWFLLCVAI